MTTPIVMPLDWAVGLATPDSYTPAQVGAFLLGASRLGLDSALGEALAPGDDESLSACPPETLHAVTNETLGGA